MVKKTLVCLFVLTLATAMFAAQRPAIAHATQIIKGTSHPQAEPASQHKLFSNVGPATNEYQLNGYFVAGSTNSILGQSQFMAVPFLMGSTGYTLVKVQAPIQYYGYGHNYVQVCLYNDNSNTPGTQVGNCISKSNLPAFGTTNTLTTFNFLSQGLALSANTQYWIVGQEPSTGPKTDSTMVWNAESIFEAGNVANGGWFSFNPDLESVMAVYGQ